MATTIPQVYVVQQGDSLSLISKKLYGDFSMTQALAEANKIANPNLIHPGQQLVVPVPAKSVETNTVLPAGNGSSPSASTTTNTTTTIKTTISKYVGWGFVLVAGLLIAYEANKQSKKNKASKK